MIKKYLDINENILKGLQVGLSGAVPEKEEWGDRAVDYEILNFIRVFSGLVMKYGGTIVHGSQPSFTPVLLEQSQLHGHSDGHNKLQLFMSNFWAKDYPKSDLGYYEKLSNFTITKEITTNNDVKKTINDSLTEMRRHLIPQMDIMVVIGGKLHRNSGITAGVEEECKMALELGIPIIILPIFGGMTSKLITQDNLLQTVELPIDETTDVAEYPSIVFNYLVQTRKPIHPQETAISTEVEINPHTDNDDLQFLKIIL